MERLFDLEGIEPAVRHVDVAGTRVHFLELGSGPALVLLHGGSGGGANWYRVIGPLSRRFRVLAPDFPGFGLTAGVGSGRPVGERGAQLVEAWLEAIGVNSCVVAGTSFGGLVAFRMGQQGRRARAVSLLDAAGLGPGLARRARLATLPLLARLLTRPTRSGTRWLLRTLLTNATLPRAHEDAICEYLYASARVARPGDFARAFRDFAGVGGQRDVIADAALRAYPVPVQVIWGESDRFLPPAHAARAALLPDSEVRLIPGVGHSPNWESPAEVATLLEGFFCARLSALEIRSGPA